MHSALWNDRLTVQTHHSDVAGRDGHLRRDAAGRVVQYSEDPDNGHRLGRAKLGLSRAAKRAGQTERAAQGGVLRLVLRRLGARGRVLQHLREREGGVCEQGLELWEP